MVRIFSRLRACVILLAWVCLLSACGGKVELLTGVPETEANEVLGTLLNAGVKAEKLPGKEGMVGLAVEERQAARAIAILRNEGLPRDHYATIGEVFRKEGLISSPLEERARYLWALSQELSATIADIDGVVKARVHVVLPERSSGGDPALPSSSAVFIKYKRGYNLDDAIPQIKRLVTNSIPGLTSDKVSVVLVSAMPRPVAVTGHDAAPAPAAGWLGATGNGAAPGGSRLVLGLLGLLAIALAGLAYLGWRIWGAPRAAAAMPVPEKARTVAG
ncbi:MAG: type III secretion system inner membrane ring lipoprotein SctJ [Noviherbaspirillum sp.]